MEARPYMPEVAAIPTDLPSSIPLTLPPSSVTTGSAQADYHLRHHILTPLETLAQSISTIAPITTPALTIPLVYALAGEGTWLAYLFALVGMTLVAYCIAVFARDSASPGSLYVYTRTTLPPAFGALAAWALFFAYVATASGIIGGFINYAYMFLGGLGPHISPVLIGGIATACAIWVAYRDVQVSTRAMLWIEGVSVFLLGVLILLLFWKHGLHLDMPQLRLHNATASGIRLGMILAVFSFVGFESATALGAEAREPLTTIPRAVIRSALLAGAFFLFCAYGEVMGFRGANPDFGHSTAPFRYLASQVGIGFIGPIIDLGVLVSMFACILGCIIAAARVLMLMAHHGLAHCVFTRTHSVHKTPGPASLLTGIAAFLPVAFMAWKGITPADIYGYLGTLAVYGFLTIYALVAIAMPIHLHRRGRLTTRAIILAASATGVMLLALIGSVYPVPPAPIRYFPYLYLAYLACGMLWYFVTTRRTVVEL